MRRSGNSSCLLLPKSNEESDEGNNDQPSVTMVTTKRLPEYSIERYYMLSEIEEHSNSIIFLEDWTRASQMTMVDKIKDSDVEDIRNVKNPSHVILYMLWQPYTYSSCRDFIESVVIKNVARIGSLVGNDDSRDSLKLYLVVDKISRDINNSDSHTCTPESKEAYHIQETKIVEDFARSVAKSTVLRPIIDGIVVGVADNLRAAPALEAVLSTVTFASSKRRHIANASTVKSIVDVVAANADELTGLDPEKEPDAVDGLKQSLTCAEWNGNGDYESFASRAHEDWMKTSGYSYLEDRDLNSVEHTSTLMILSVFTAVLAYFCYYYSFPDLSHIFSDLFLQIANLYSNNN